jgi:hypothetical protein
MSKFIKRISKSINVEGNALVIGDGFGFVFDILSLFPSVFVVLNEHQRIKAKNVIYRDTLDSLHLLPSINVVFLDLKFKHRLDEFENIMIHAKPIFLIEGNDPLEREWTKKFYQLGYRAIDQQGYFHQWKKTH